MGTFDGINEAPVFEFGTYMPPNFEGDVQFESLIVKKTLNKGDAFIAEFTLLTSNLPDHPPGAKRTWFVKMIDPTTALPNIKQMVFGTFGIDHNGPAAATVSSRLNTFLQRAVGPENIMVGLRAHLTTQATTTKKGTIFTRHSWGPPSGEANPSFDQVFAMPSRLAPPPPPPTERYYPDGTAPGRGATHVLRNGGWVPL